MRHSRIQTVCLFLFTILMISGMARPQDAESLTSYIDEHNRFILNGEPFFPIGLYVVQCSNGTSYYGQLDAITAPDSPFDTLMNYAINRCGTDATEDQIDAYLDQLQSRNLKLIFSLAEYFDNGQADIDTITHKVNTFKDHPAIISWYLNDERDPATYLTQLEERYVKIREIDENHPVWSVHWKTGWLLPEAHTTDILGMDSYPIAHLPITTVSKVADAAAQVGAQTDKPFWLVPQIFNWNDYPTDFRAATGRPPTWEEMRAMTYLAVNHGAKGLVYYSYFNIVDDDIQYGTDVASRWEEIKGIASEIDQLRPVFLSVEQTNVNDIVCDNADIDFKLMREGNTYYLFAVNTELPHEVIMDNSDASYVGNWPSYSGNTQIYGSDAQYHEGLGTGANTATWTPNIAESGQYEVYAWWHCHSNRATDAPFTIVYDGGSETVDMNQEINGGQWNLLGTYSFAAGTSGYVQLSDDANEYVIADAIKWRRQHLTTVTFQISLAYKPGIIDTMFEGGRQISVIDGKVTDDFDLYEVHVYYWEEPERNGGGGSNGSSGGGCFIATTAFGSYLHPYVQVIKDFRDEYLLKNMPGRWFVGMYNTYGPFWADLLNAHSSCKPFVRLALLPVVGISYFVLKTSLAMKLLTGFLLMGFVVICVLRIHGRSVTSGLDLGSGR